MTTLWVALQNESSTAVNESIFANVRLTMEPYYNYVVTITSVNGSFKGKIQGMDLLSHVLKFWGVTTEDGWEG